MENYNIHVKIQSKITKDGNAIDLSTDPTAKKTVNDLIKTSDE